MTQSERHAQATATYRAAKDLRAKYPINDRPTGKNSPILVEMNHVGKPIETGDDEQPQTETGRRNAAIVEAWRHSIARNAAEPAMIAQPDASAPKAGKVSTDAQNGVESGKLTWSEWRIVYPDGSVSTMTSRADTQEEAEKDLLGGGYYDKRLAMRWRIVRVKCGEVAESRQRLLTVGMATNSDDGGV